MIKILFLLSLLPLTSFAESRIKIGILDTGLPQIIELSPLLCKDNYHVTPDTNGHATKIGLVFLQEKLDNKKYCLYFRGGTFNPKTGFDMEHLYREMELMISMNVKYLNVSLSGKWSYEKENKLLELFLRKNVKVFVAAGNDAQNLTDSCMIYPACYYLNNYTNWTVVGSTDNSGKRLKNSNYGAVVTQYENGIICYGQNCTSGTSFASPRALIKSLDK